MYVICTCFPSLIAQLNTTKAQYLKNIDTLAQTYCIYECEGIHCTSVMKTACLEGLNGTSNEFQAITFQ